MANLKKYLVVILTITLIISLVSVPSMADGISPGEELKAAGLLADGDRPSDTAKRLEALVMVLQLMGEADAAASFMNDDEAVAYLKAHNKITDNILWGASIIAYCADRGYLFGDEYGDLNPEGECTAETFSAYINRIIVSPSNPPVWGENIAVLSSAGAYTDSKLEEYIVSKSFTRGNAFEIMKGTLGVITENGGSVAQNLYDAGKLGSDAAALLNVPVNTPEPTEKPVEANSHVKRKSSNNDDDGGGNDSNNNNDSETLGNVHIRKAEATSVNTIEIYFDDRLEEIDTDEFTLSVSSSVYVPEIISCDLDSNNDGNSILIMSLDSETELNYDGTYTDDDGVTANVYVNVAIDSDGEFNTENCYGQTVTTESALVVDEIAPALAQFTDDGDIVRDEVNYDTVTHTIEMIFEEDIHEIYVTDFSFSIDSSVKVIEITCSGPSIFIELGDNDIIDYGTKIIQEYMIRDLQGNRADGITTQVNKIDGLVSDGNGGGNDDNNNDSEDDNDSETSANVHICKAEATNVNTIEVYFDDQLEKFDTDEFTLSVAGSVYAPEIVFYDLVNNSGSNSILVMSLDSETELNYDGTYTDDDGVTANVYVNVAIDLDGEFNTENCYGQTVTTESALVMDEIAPALAQFVNSEDVLCDEVNYNTAMNRIELIFEEDIDSRYVNDYSFSVDALVDVENITVSGSSIFIVLEGNETINYGTEIIQRMEIKDLEGNRKTGITTQVNKIDGLE